MKVQEVKVHEVKDQEEKVQDEKKTKIELGSFKSQVGKTHLNVDESEKSTKQRAIVPLDYTIGDYGVKLNARHW
jgi:hypothetical protein